MSKDSKKKRKCPVCDAEIDEEQEVCPECGSFQEEPCFDIMDDEGEE